ncbi:MULTISPECIES: S41 family peptidase [unclassified Streptosporangium]|uniref:S41 family peptidase n=1 Tax=unclassified Streptosporangium TaxID=2632669 RepID=UPI002E2DE190|nr:MULTISPECIES: S41 family peptidase [unclassified Streptosporangium]
MIRTFCAALLVTACSVSAPASAFASDPAPRPKPSSPSAATPGGDCAPATAPPPESAPPTSVNTLRQAYFCVLDNYYSGPAMDSREPLKSAFAAYTQDLMRRGIDRADLRLPALTGNRDSDWAAYAKVLGTDDPAALRAAITGMVAGLHDNHARWVRPTPPSESGPVGTGIVGTSAQQGPQLDPAARPPLFITRVLPGSPAAEADVRPGDIVVKANGMPPFAGDKVNQSFVDALASDTVRITLKRPTTGRTRTVELREGPLTRQPPAATSKTLPGGVAYVQLSGFHEGAADQVIAKLQGKPKAVVLDLRGNGGGSPREVTRLLGAFAHGKITSYFCPLKGDCVPNRTDDGVPLLGLRLVVLTDRGCASACDDFSAAVKGNGLGTLVGTRTAGAISGPAAAYLLDDGSVLRLPKVRHLGPAREIIDTIGVPVDHYAPMTALDLATGRDPGVAKALTLL